MQPVLLAFRFIRHRNKLDVTQSDADTKCVVVITIDFRATISVLHSLRSALNNKMENKYNMKSPGNVTWSKF